MPDIAQAREFKAGDEVTSEFLNSLLRRISALERLVESLLRSRPGSLGTVHVMTPPGGIDPATDNDTPSAADCMIRVFDGTTFADSGITVRVYNKGGAIAGDVDIVASPEANKPGHLFARVVYC